MTHNRRRYPPMVTHVVTDIRGSVRPHEYNDSVRMFLLMEIVEHEDIAEDQPNSIKTVHWYTIDSWGSKKRWWQNCELLLRWKI